ncbi:MAG: M14 family metallopeptidase [Rhodothermales bacterium]
MNRYGIRPLGLLYALLLVAALRPSVYAQGRLESPAEFLGYELGDRFTPHHRMVAYFEHVAAHSPRVTVESYGETYEGRPLIAAFVTAPERLPDLESVRMNHLRRTGEYGPNEGPPEGTPASTEPAIVWLGYNVHGNEAVSMEAAMQTLYELADPSNARTGAWLREAVVVIDPCLNPDGRDRYATWYNQRVGRFPNAAPEAWEHEEPWPGGRTNHYYFDLNRDWSWTTQQEVLARVANYNRWMPHVHVDFHEQGVDQPYYFAPAAEPYHEVITPWQRAFQDTIGRNNARYFDENGWLYFTGQVYDLLYPGYGDSWPTYNGSIGMTYEQGGSGRAGLAIVTAEGDTLTLRDRIDHHYTTGMATIEATVENREQVLAEFGAFFDRAVAAPAGPYRTYVLKNMERADTRHAIEAHLERQGIRFGYADRSRSASGYRYSDGATGRFAIEPGDMILTAFQPRSSLLKVLFEPRTALSDTLTYDMTAWALPYVYGVEAYATTDRIEPAASSPATTAPPAVRIDRPYAYLLPWQGFDDARFLADITRRGVRMRYAEKSFSMDGQTFAPGTLILTRAGNRHLGDRFDAIVRTASRAFERTIVPVASGLATDGADLGSADVIFAEPPRVAVLMGEPTRSNAAGEVWHYFDQQLGYPVTLLDAGDFNGGELSGYNVLVMPSGSYGSALPAATMERVREWVERGGRLIAMEGAVRFLAGQEGFRIRRVATDEAPADSAALDARRYGNRERDALSDEIQGAIFRVSLDTSHPLAFGYSDTYFTLKFGDALYERLTDTSDWNVGVLASPEPVSGFVGADVQKRIGRHLAIGTQSIGRGDVVYIADNPLFRGFWYNGRLLVANAVFFR